MDVIGALTAENRQTRSPDTEAELVRLRLEEGRRIFDQAKGQPIERFECEDLFAGTSGLPQIAATALSADSLAAGILFHGGLLVRGLYSDQQVERLQCAADLDTQREPDADSRLGCSAHTLFELMEIYRDSGLLDAVRGYLGSHPLLFGERVKLRRQQRQRDKYAAIPWHQDAAFFGRKSYAVNCWAAVTACGEDNPGLSILPCRTEAFHGWNPDDGHAPLDYGRALSADAFDEVLRKHAPAECVLQPGDAVIFDEMTVHQTLLRPWRIDEQLVTISWFFRPSGFPEWGTPLAV